MLTKMVTINNSIHRAGLAVDCLPSQAFLLLCVLVSLPNMVQVPGGSTGRQSPASPFRCTKGFPCSQGSQRRLHVAPKQLPALFALHTMNFCTLANGNFKSVLKTPFESARKAIFLPCCCEVEQKREVHSEQEQPEGSGLCCAPIRCTISSKRFSAC